MKKREKSLENNIYMILGLVVVVCSIILAVNMVLSREKYLPSELNSQCSASRTATLCSQVFILNACCNRTLEMASKRNATQGWFRGLPWWSSG